MGFPKKLQKKISKQFLLKKRKKSIPKNFNMKSCTKLNYEKDMLSHKQFLSDSISQINFL